MNETPNETPFNTPQFVREREAWYKAGADVMTAYSAISVLLVSTIISLASFFISIGPYQAAIATLIGTWLCIAICSAYIGLNARKVATRGGVEIDRF